MRNPIPPAETLVMNDRFRPRAVIRDDCFTSRSITYHAAERLLRHRTLF